MQIFPIYFTGTDPKARSEDTRVPLACSVSAERGRFSLLTCLRLVPSHLSHDTPSNYKPNGRGMFFDYVRRFTHDQASTTVRNVTGSLSGVQSLIEKVSNTPLAS